MHVNKDADPLTSMQKFWFFFLKSLCIYLSKQPSFQSPAKPRAKPRNNSVVQTPIKITQITMQCKENVFRNLLKAKEIMNWQNIRPPTLDGWGQDTDRPPSTAKNNKFNSEIPDFLQSLRAFQYYSDTYNKTPTSRPAEWNRTTLQPTMHNTKSTHAHDKL